MNEPLILALVGPSGVGKTTLCRILAQAEEANLQEVISTTTRDPRPNEENGVDYIFLERDEAETQLERGEYLEHVHYDGNLYGFLRASFEGPLSEGKNIVVVVERHGLKQLQREYGDQVYSVLIVPPSLDELELRLRKDGRDDETIARRLKKANEEVHKERELFDAVLVNDDLNVATHEMSTLYHAFRIIQKGKK